MGNRFVLFLKMSSYNYTPPDETLAGVRRGQTKGGIEFLKTFAAGGAIWMGLDRKHTGFSRFPFWPKMIGLFSGAFCWGFMSCQWEMTRYKQFCAWRRSQERLQKD